MKFVTHCRSQVGTGHERTRWITTKTQSPVRTLFLRGLTGQDRRGRQRIPAGGGDPFSLRGEKIPSSRLRTVEVRSGHVLIGGHGTGHERLGPKSKVEPIGQELGRRRDGTRGFTEKSPKKLPRGPQAAEAARRGRDGTRAGRDTFRRVSTRPPCGRRHTISSPLQEGKAAPLRMASRRPACGGTGPIDEIGTDGTNDGTLPLARMTA